MNKKIVQEDIDILLKKLEVNLAQIMSMNQNISAINLSMPYKSYIGINNYPTIPPMISQNKSSDLMEYKNKALNIEKRVQCQRTSMLLNKIHSIIDELEPSFEESFANLTDMVKREDCNKYITDNIFQANINRQALIFKKQNFDNLLLNTISLSDKEFAQNTNSRQIPHSSPEIKPIKTTIKYINNDLDNQDTPALFRSNSFVVKKPLMNTTTIQEKKNEFHSLEPIDHPVQPKNNPSDFYKLYQNFKRNNSFSHRNEYNRTSSPMLSLSSSEDKSNYSYHPRARPTIPNSFLATNQNNRQNSHPHTFPNHHVSPISTQISTKVKLNGHTSMPNNGYACNNQMRQERCDNSQLLASQEQKREETRGKLEHMAKYLNGLVLPSVRNLKENGKASCGQDLDHNECMTKNDEDMINNRFEGRQPNLYTPKQHSKSPKFNGNTRSGDAQDAYLQNLKPDRNMPIPAKNLPSDSAGSESSSGSQDGPRENCSTHVQNQSNTYARQFPLVNNNGQSSPYSCIGSDVNCSLTTSGNFQPSLEEPCDSGSPPSVFNSPQSQSPINNNNNKLKYNNSHQINNNQRQNNNNHNVNNNDFVVDNNNGTIRSSDSSRPTSTTVVSATHLPVAAKASPYLSREDEVVPALRNRQNSLRIIQRHQRISNGRTSANSSYSLNNTSIIHILPIEETKLAAFVKGYLVRRILKTAKMTHLKTTIKDTLACLYQLNAENLSRQCKALNNNYANNETRKINNNSSTRNENGENGLAGEDNLGDMMDHELEERLTAQLACALDEIHEIFFDYTPAQRMKLIELDRNVLLTKLQRKEDEDRKRLAIKKQLLEASAAASQPNGGLSASYHNGHSHKPFNAYASFNNNGSSTNPNVKTRSNLSTSYSNGTTPGNSRLVGDKPAANKSYNTHTSTNGTTIKSNFFRRHNTLPKKYKLPQTAVLTSSIHKPV